MKFKEHTGPLFKELLISPLDDINKEAIALFMFRYFNNNLRGRGARCKVGGLTIENNFFILKIEKRNKIIVFDFQKVGAGAQKSSGAAALPAPPPPRSLNLPSSFNDFFFLNKDVHQHNTRSSSNVHKIQARLANYQKLSVKYEGVSIWNNLPNL